MRRPERVARRRRPGAMLFEVMLSLALFVGAGTLCLSVTKSLAEALQRTQLQQEAIDLARSKLAELEAGLTTIGDLRGEWSGAIGSIEPDDDLDGSGRPSRWSFEVNTTRTEFSGLSLVALTVSENTGPLADSEAFSVTLRQLMTLREIDPEMYESDELLEDLPEAGS